MKESEGVPRALADRMFRVALRVLPKAFRSAYGGGIYEFHQARMEKVYGARWRSVATWLQDILDLLMGAVGEWARAAKETLVRGRGTSVEFGGATGPGRGGGWERPGLGLRGEIFLQDLRFALRSLCRSPGFSLVSVFSLAVGIGLVAAFFSFFQKTWLEPIPGVARPEGVVELTVIQRGSEGESWTFPDFRDLREAETPFLEIAGWKERDGTLYTPNGGEYVHTMSVSADYFQLLGVVPALGRAFLPEEDQGPGQHPVAVVSFGMWQARLGGSPSVVGETVVLNQVPYTVVGVAPEGFTGHRALVQPTEIWVPLVQDPWIAGSDSWVEDRASMWLRVLGRLRESAALEEANAALNTLFSRFEEDHPETNVNRRARAYAFGPVPAVGRAESLYGTLLLFGLLGIVLVIISGNVAGMVLARSVTREQEIAVRLALGSGRNRLARLLLLEALILSVSGGVAGVLLGVWGMDAAYALMPGAPPLEFPLGWHLCPPALALVLFTTLLVGALPAIRFSRPELISSLREGVGGTGRRAGRIHRFAASSQAGLALSLLVVSTLFVRAVGVLYESDLGFEPAGLVTSRIDLSGVGIESPEVAAVFFDRVLGAVETVPGVARVTMADGHPVDLVGNFTHVSRLDHSGGESAGLQVEFTRVAEGYFETIGVPVLRGRGILETDDLASEPVVVLTESLAERLWPGEDPLGQRVESASSRTGPTEFTVVGIVGDVASSRPTETWPNIFFSLLQNPYSRVMVMARASGDPTTLFRPLRAALLSVEPSLPFPDVQRAQDMVDRAAGSQRMSAAIAGGLGALAILLAAIGVYGVVAFAVSRRSREIGLRMAMGASRGGVRTKVLVDAVALTAPGLLVGAVLAAGSAAAFRAQLYGLSPLDPVAFLGAGGVLLVVVFLAGLIPAWKASVIDPMVALRQE